MKPLMLFDNACGIKFNVLPVTVVCGFKVKSKILGCYICVRRFFCYKEVDTAQACIKNAKVLAVLAIPIGLEPEQKATGLSDNIRDFYKILMTFE